MLAERKKNYCVMQIVGHVTNHQTFSTILTSLGLEPPVLLYSHVTYLLS